MVNYLIKSSLYLLALLVFYHLFLEREKMHKFNRFYLLSSVLFSFCAPLFVIYVEAPQIPVEVKQSLPLSESFEIIENQPTIISEEKFDYTQLLYGFYGLVTLFLLVRFIKNIINIFSRIKRHTKIKINKATIVLLNDTIIPHTFWNYIFINKKEYQDENFNKELLTHELTHVEQYHTIDILCVEILKIVFWFNPFLYILKRLIQLNHEFLADEKVIETHKNIGNYQNLLLERSLLATSYQLTSNLNYSVTKKRLSMMTTQSSQTNIWIKKLVLIPLVAGLVFLFAERVEAQEFEGLDQDPIYQKTLDTYMEYKNRNSYITTKDEKGNTIKVPFSQLSDEKKKKLHPASPLKIKKKIVTKEIFKNLKNEKINDIIYIDDVVVEKDELNKYKASDFSYYTAQFINFNEKLNKYMLHHKLETNLYFENKNKKNEDEFISFLQKEKRVDIDEHSIKKIMNDYSRNYSLVRYNYFYNKYNSLRNEQPHFIKKSKDQKILINNYFTLLEEQYSKLSKEEKSKIKKAINPYYPYTKITKNNKVFYQLGEELIQEDNVKVADTIKKAELDNSNLADFNIEIEKNGSTFKLKCTKGCDWKELTFNLNINESKTIDQFGAGNKTDYSSDFKILVENIENTHTGYSFSVESLKGTNWLDRIIMITKNKTEITQHLY